MVRSGGGAVAALVAAGVQQSLLYASLAKSHVVVDQGMVGAERIPLEGALCGNVVVVGSAFAGSGANPPAVDLRIHDQ